MSLTSQKYRIEFRMLHLDPPVEEYVDLYCVGMPSMALIKQRVIFAKPHYEPFINHLQYITHYGI